MKVSNIINHVRFARTSKLVVASAFVLALSAIVGFGFTMKQQTASADSFVHDCTSNDVIKCGFTSPADFVNKYKANATGDLPAIYSRFGLNSGDLSAFANQAKLGYAYKNGNIVVDGQVVATNTWSLGRNTGNGNDHTISIGGKTYYWGYNSTAFAHDPLPVYVLFDGNGQIKFASLPACANPIMGNGVANGESCKTLNMTQQSNTQYTFSTNAPTTGNAKVAKVVYDFGDGQTQTSTSASASIPHTYAKPGDYTVKVTVYVSLPGGNSKTILPAGDCIKHITVKEEKKPIFTCTALTATLEKDSKDTFDIKVTADAENGAVLQTADFTFSGTNYNETANGIKPSSTNVVTITHKFPAQGDYTISANLNFNDGKDQNNQNCQAKVTVTGQTCAETPNLPQCQPPTCTTSPNMPQCQPTCANTPSMAQCQPTPELPKTGPTEVIGGTLGLGSVAGAGYYYVGSRRNLLKNLLHKR